MPNPSLAESLAQLDRARAAHEAEALSYPKGNIEIYFNGRLILSGLKVRVFEHSACMSVRGDKIGQKYKIELESIDS